jgi:arylsulfatase A-like enzyme
MSPPPNVLFIAVDAMRRDRLGCYGHPGALTPQLDKFAGQSRRFDHMISGGTWTQAAFPSLLTSTYASMFNGCLGPLSPERPSPIAELQNAGYQTIGVTSNPLTGLQYGYNRGFDQFYELRPTRKDPRIRYRKGGQSLLRSPLTHRFAQRMGQDLRPGPVYLPAEAVNRQALAALEQSSGPHFLWLHYMDVHWPYHINEELTHPSHIATAWQDVAAFHEASWGNASLSAQQQAHFIQLYEYALQCLDRDIGRLLDGLSRSGWLEDALVIVVADHGEEFYDHGRWGHMEVNFHDEVSRVPLLVRAPRWDHGQAGLNRSIDSLVDSLDIMPTILDYCGVEPPDGMLGASLKGNYSAAEHVQDDKIAFSERWRPPESMIAAHTPRFKLIWDETRPTSPRLYDLINDPGELQDQAAAYPDITARLNQAVQEHLARVGASQTSASASQIEMDDEMLDRMRALGYVE